MRLICLAVLLVAQVFGQVEKTAEQLEAEKRDPKKKAAVLLDNAGQAVGAARPEVQVFGLLHLAENYEPIDKKKSLEYFIRPSTRRPRYQRIAIPTSVDSCSRKSSEVWRR